MATSAKIKPSATMADLNEPANRDENMDDIRSDIAALREDLASLFSSVKDLAVAKSETGVDAGKEMAGKAQENLEQTKMMVETQVRSNPLTSIAVAMGVGALFATLRRKS